MGEAQAASLTKHPESRGYSGERWTEYDGVRVPSAESHKLPGRGPITLHLLRLENHPPSEAPGAPRCSPRSSSESPKVALILKNLARFLRFSARPAQDHNEQIATSRKGTAASSQVPHPCMKVTRALRAYLLPWQAFYSSPQELSLDTSYIARVWEQPSKGRVGW